MAFRLCTYLVFVVVGFSLTMPVLVHAANSSSPNLTGLSGCKNDHQNIDYPLAVDCILPSTNVCPPPENVDTPNPCNYNAADLIDNTRKYRDNSARFQISHIVIHDTEGTGSQSNLAREALNYFKDPKSAVSIHYVVGSDGTVYQVLREKDMAFHAGNLWYNEHSIGIEHAGYEGSGFSSYTPAMYAASAKLVAYLTNKYDIPVDHAHIVSHGTVPSPYFAVGPNHLDPGPYFNFTSYFDSIAPAKRTSLSNVITVKSNPASLEAPEQPTDCNFFYVYDQPSTASHKFAANLVTESDLDANASSSLDCSNPPTDPTNRGSFSVSNNVESEMSYYYVDKKPDSAGSGKMMYKIWYGENSSAKGAFHAQLVWLAVPPAQTLEGQAAGKAQVITLCAPKNSSVVPVFGRPTTATPSSYESPLPQGVTSYQLGDAPSGATFLSAYTVKEDVGGRLWYEINYNHRQAWVPADEVTVNQ